MDADQLNQLRETWAATLGHVNLMASLLDALDHPIDELEQGEYDHAGYEVIHQVSRYRRVSWKAICQQLGSPRVYLDRCGKVLPEYRYAFENEYEAKARLSFRTNAWKQWC